MMNHIGCKKGAHLSILVGELESAHETKNLINVAANGKIVDDGGANGSLAINDEGATVCDTFVLLEDAIAGGDGLRDVGKEGNLHVAKTALVAGLLDPSEMGELGIYRDTENFSTNLA
eukprot:335174_1